MPNRIITTEDGSHSLFNEELNETYHSTRGAIGESIHVFIKEGLEYFLDKSEKKVIRILEVGFGTGLNAFLTEQFAKRNKVEINFTTLEPFPIDEEIYKKLNYSRPNIDSEIFLAIHQSPWEEEMRISSQFQLHKTKSQLEYFHTNQLFNIIYFDAFAPSKQPEMWSLENLKKCYDLLSSGGILTTYCAQGQFKRNLETAGFKVETLQGAMGKKEMVRAKKL